MSGIRNGTSLGDVPLYHVVALLVTFAAAWGSLAGRASTQPARASAPAANPLGGGIATGYARPDVSTSEAPRVGAGTQLAAAAGEDPQRPAAAAHQCASAP